MYSYKDIDVLIGKTMVEVERCGSDDQVGECIIFKCDDGTEYSMFHSQGCCENVYLEDVNGNLDDLVGSPITAAEQSTNHNNDELPESEREWPPESYTWTFYHLRTAKGSVDIRWFGSSNGWYGETADVMQTK